MRNDPQRIPPTSSERSVIGAIMRQPSLLADVLEFLGPEDFACPYAGATLALMRARAGEGFGIDEISLPEAIVRAARPDRYPTASELLGWADGVVSTAALPAWVREVRECSTLRAIRAGVEEIDTRGKRGETSAELLRRMTTLVQELALKADHGKGPEQLGVTADAVLDDLANPQPEAAPIPTGLLDLDDALNGGLHKGDLVIIGGRPGMGKTALGVQMADHATIFGASVLMFSAEMSKKKIAMRQLAAHSDISFSRLLKADKLTQAQVESLRASAANMHRIPWATDDRSAPSLETIVAVAKRHMLTAGGLDILLIDYFQILTHGGRGDLQDKERMIYGLRDFARDNDVCVVLLTQLNRDGAKRSNKRPVMEDIKGCGGIEEAACTILFPYRPGADDDSADPSSAEIIIAKQREGADGTVLVSWDGPAIRYRER